MCLNQRPAHSNDATSGTPQPSTKARANGKNVQHAPATTPHTFTSSKAKRVVPSNRYHN